jgi:hypothetical protein
MVLVYQLAYAVLLIVGLGLCVYGGWLVYKSARTHVYLGRDGEGKVKWGPRAVGMGVVLAGIALLIGWAALHLVSTGVAYAPKVLSTSAPRQIREEAVPDRPVPEAKNKIGSKEPWDKVMERTEETNKENREKFSEDTKKKGR